MIDVYTTAGTLKDPAQLTHELVRTLMVIEQVPDIPMFQKNTAVFIHQLPHGALSNIDGQSNYVGVQVLPGLWTGPNSWRSSASSPT